MSPDWLLRTSFTLVSCVPHFTLNSYDACHLIDYYVSYFTFNFGNLYHPIG